jgi:hypothetical protein
MAATRARKARTIADLRRGGVGVISGVVCRSIAELLM